MFCVNEEHLLLRRLLLLLLLRLARIRGSHSIGGDRLRFQCRVALKEFFYLLDLFVPRVEVFGYLQTGDVLLHVVGVPVGHLARDQVHEAAVVVSGCVLLHFGLDIVQAFLQQSAEEVIAYLDFLL